MFQTKHFKERKKQRGVSDRMIDLVIQYGELRKDKVILGKKNTGLLLHDLKNHKSELLKILDKGGLVVVVQEDTMITTYQFRGYTHSDR